MSTPAAVNLPLELILLATEEAAWGDLDTQMQTSETAIRRWRQWVASLCTVCRAFEPAMARILYTLVHVLPGNVDAVLRAAEMDTHPFRRARAVYFDIRGISLADERASALSAAFQHVHAYTGLLNDLRPLLNDRIHSRDTRPLSVHFVHSWDAFDLSTVTISAERLHILFGSSNVILTDAVDLSRFRTRFLILDIINATNNIVVDNLSQILKVQTLERILVRPSTPWNSIRAEALEGWVRSFAETARSPTIWFDDSFPAYGSIPMGRIELRLHRHLSDAMIGDDLWLRGRQLYIPE